MFTYLFVISVGLVTAGLVRNFWPLLTGQDVSLALVEQRDFWLPIRVMVLVMSAPVLLIGAGLRELTDASGGIVKLWLTVPTAMGWAFVQGVVVVVSLSAIV